jgi:hypothetical protein
LGVERDAGSKSATSEASFIGGAADAGVHRAFALGGVLAGKHMIEQTPSSWAQDNRSALLLWQRSAALAGMKE